MELDKKSPEAQKEFLRRIPKAQLTHIMHSWEWTARPSQLEPPGEWSTWLLLAGRRFGKSYCAKQWLANELTTYPGQYAWYSKDAAEARDNIGDPLHGVVSLIGKDQIATVDSRDLIWRFKNGSVLFGGTGQSPDNRRGKGFSGVVLDELAYYAKPNEVLTVVNFGLSAGRGKKLITTTPSQSALTLLRDLEADFDTVVTRGTTFENLQNLEGSVAKTLLRVDGTLTGKLELYAQLIDLDGQLFKNEWFRHDRSIDPESMDQVVVSWDPSVSSDNNEDGIIVAGRAEGKGYILADRSTKGTPDHVAKTVIKAFNDYKANWVICERNNGGDYLPHAIHTIDPDIPIRLVTATRGKGVRAEPVSIMYQKGEIIHTDRFQTLETQMVEFDSAKVRDRIRSPDRLDAMVWAMWALFLDKEKRSLKMSNINLNLHSYF